MISASIFRIDIPSVDPGSFASSLLKSKVGADVTVQNLSCGWMVV
jgi:hypothetical protein